MSSQSVVLIQKELQGNFPFTRVCEAGARNPRPDRQCPWGSVNEEKRFNLPNFIAIQFEGVVPVMNLVRCEEASFRHKECICLKSVKSLKSA